MKRYIYNYQTIVNFSEPVINHSLLLRCQPIQGAYMTIDEEHLIMSPGFSIRRGVDQFGNRIVYGGQRDPHTSLAYISAGVVSMSHYVIRCERGVSPIYLMPTHLTAISPANRIERTASVADDAMAICHQVYHMMNYVPFSTTVDTPASKVLQCREGVCQDYAHLMIGFCRVSSIPARYVCGFLEGVGETHAWVEVYDGYSWIAFDPTNDCRIIYGYAKLAHGRDASDCSVSRGIYAGLAIQQTQINVTLKEI